MGLNSILAVALTLSGCLTYTVKPSDVFQTSQSHQSETLKFEDLLQSSSAVEIDIQSGREKASYSWAGGQYRDIKIERGSTGPEELQTDYMIMSLPSSASTENIILHCGGAGSNLYQSSVIYGLKAVNFGTVINFDYKSSEDGVTTESLESTIRDIAAFTIETAEGAPIILWGHSAGGAVCALLSQYIPQAEVLILETTADSVENAVNQLTLPGLRNIMKPVLSADLKAYDIPILLKDYIGRVLVMGAAQDGILPIALSESLCITLKKEHDNVTCVVFPDANHLSVSHQPNFSLVVEDFLRDDR